MSDQSAAGKTDLLVRLVLEAVDLRLKDIRDEVARVAAESSQHRQDVARLADELGRWLTAKAQAESAMTSRVDELSDAVMRLTQLERDRA